MNRKLLVGPGRALRVARVAVLAGVGIVASRDGLRAEPGGVLGDSLRACARLSENFERLTCFDRVAASLDPSSTAPVTPQAPTAEQVFGIDKKVQADKARSRAPAREEMKSITARVEGFRRLPDGEVVMQLDNGQVWRQLGGGFGIIARTGDTVVITRAAMGSFRMTTASGRFARVKRVR